MNVAVAVLSDNSVTFIRTNIIRPYKLAVKIGGQSELHCTAVGKVFLAYMEPLEREEYLRTAEMEKYTETTLTTPDALSRDIAQVRERGYAIADREEFYQVVGMAAPILDYEDRILAALSLWIPTRFASLEELQSNAPALLETASTISKRFGSMA
jgi:DNA-binding IclR family transcriptional regulator